MHLDIYMWWRRLAEFQTEHQNGKKGDLSDFECGMFVDARRAGLSILKRLIYWDFIHTHL